MIIMRISPGLANSMYEFAAAYALARELNQELVLDIAECTVSAWGYSLDYFNIPRVKKMIYPALDATKPEHTDVMGIPEAVRNNKMIYVGEADGEYRGYAGLAQASGMNMDKDIYLCGYFFDRDRYYLKYWDEIRALFTLKEQFPEVEKFKDIIRGRVSVGVHIRRGDMLLADWAVKMEDDYYKAAISCCREHFGECIFMIFSDDIEYAQTILGQDSSLYYVHFLGCDDAALKEFICLSLCTHRIMSNSSTFSSLADELNWAEERKTFWKNTAGQDIGSNVSTIDLSRRNIRLSKYDIERYSKEYRTDEKENMEGYKEGVTRILQEDIDENNCREVLEKICSYSLNVFEMESRLEAQLLYKNFLVYLNLQKFQTALQSAFKLYHEYAGNRQFTEGLIQALLSIGAYEEAVVEQIRIGKKELDYGSCDSKTLGYCKRIAGKLTSGRKHFIIVPWTTMFASSRIMGLAELGMVLYHLGHKVSFVFEPYNESERTYICENKRLINRQGICLGCWQYLEEDIGEKTEEFLSRFVDDDIVVVSRRSKYFVDKKNMGGFRIQYVFPDFSDMRDAESLPAGREIDSGELGFLSRKADLILTKSKDKEKENEKYVLWEDNDSKDVYETIDEDWEFGKMGRLSKRAIGMAADMIANLY